jgi:UPF0176 protein
MGKILIFYKYIDIRKPSEEVSAQKKLCRELGLTGRIYIAQEGINATVGGTDDATEAYKQALRAHPLFFDADIKESPGGADYFPRLQVTAKKQAVNFGVSPEEVSAKDAGTYLSPEEAHQLFAQKSEDVIILDARNDYEWRVGAFTNALKPPISNFRDLPQYLDEHLADFKDKRVVMYCTSGIRCERATAYLKKKQVAKEVFHIKGGIQRYTQTYKDGYFRGKNYVFDARVTEKITDDILANCDHCKKPNDDYTNCVNAQCNKQLIACPDCIGLYQHTCSDQCAELVKTGAVQVRVIFRKKNPIELTLPRD